AAAGRCGVEVDGQKYARNTDLVSCETLVHGVQLGVYLEAHARPHLLCNSNFKKVLGIGLHVAHALCRVDSIVPGETRQQRILKRRWREQAVVSGMNYRLRLL